MLPKLITTYNERPNIDNRIWYFTKIYDEINCAEEKIQY